MDNALDSLGVMFVRNPELFGHPDFTVLNSKIAVFCDGDFWHGYRFGSNPRLNVLDNRAFWMAKIKSNIKRDRSVTEKLEVSGWTVLRFWEHDIKADAMGCARKVLEKVGEK